MTKENKRANDEAEIRALIDDWANAMRAKNSERVTSHYSDNVMFVLAPPLQVAGSRDTKNLKAWFATWQGPIGYDIRELTITAGDNVAFAIASTG
ncbi:MAG: YybH family protein [Burkholderiales bacterium]